MKIQGRQASDTLAEAAGKVLDVEPTGETEQTHFSTLVHWGCGTS